MKIIINENQLLEIISGEFNEVKIEKKDLLGSGAYHNVYPSKLNPNIVYKIGSKQSIDSWIETFKSHPEIFPKVYRRGNTKIKTPYGDHDVDYVAIEKLETKSFEDFWMLIAKYFDYMLKGVLRSYNSNLSVIKNRGDMILDNEGEETYKKFLELLDVVKTLFTIKKDPDITPLNFGFDKNGNIKCLDI